MGHHYSVYTVKKLAVFDCPRNDKSASLLDARFYLPKPWTFDKEHCDKAKISLDQREFITKLKLAQDIIKNQIYKCIVFNHMGHDGLNRIDFNLN